MKLAAAQILPFKGDLGLNIEKHLDFVSRAVAEGAGLILFPELSLTSYESKRARELASTAEDPRLEVFQQKSDAGNIIICAGLPTRHAHGIRISMLIFEPGKRMQVYSKRFLHADELPYFVPGQDTFLIEAENRAPLKTPLFSLSAQVERVGVSHKKGLLEVPHILFAPAICYESTLVENAASAAAAGAKVYLAPVADSASGVEKAFRIYPEYARKYKMTILFSNALGPCDDFICRGSSAVWNERGELMGQLGEEEEGLLYYDTEAGE